MMLTRLSHEQLWIHNRFLRTCIQQSGEWVIYRTIYELERKPGRLCTWTSIPRINSNQLDMELVSWCQNINHELGHTTGSGGGSFSIAV